MQHQHTEQELRHKQAQEDEERLLRELTRILEKERKDYYNILGIKANATSEEIKKAYKKKALQWHPDRNPNNKEEAEKNFKEINEANSFLSNVRVRAHYDNAKQPSTAHAANNHKNMPTANDKQRQNLQAERERLNNYYQERFDKVMRGEKVAGGVLGGEDGSRKVAEMTAKITNLVSEATQAHLHKQKEKCLAFMIGKCKTILTSKASIEKLPDQIPTDSKERKHYDSLKGLHHSLQNLSNFTQKADSDFKNGKSLEDIKKEGRALLSEVQKFSAELAQEKSILSRLVNHDPIADGAKTAIKKIDEGVIDEGETWRLSYGGKP